MKEGEDEEGDGGVEVGLRGSEGLVAWHCRLVAEFVVYFFT